jgi:hypothetical protein
MITDKQYDTLAQLSHFGWGFGIVALGAAIEFRVEWKDHQAMPGHWYLIVAVAWILYAAVKEFYFDERDQYETAEMRGSSLEDFLFQLAGAAFSVLTLWLAWNV